MAADFIVDHFQSGNAGLYMERVQLGAVSPFACFTNYIVLEKQVVCNAADIDAAAGQGVQREVLERFGDFVCGPAVVFDDVVSYDVTVGPVGLGLSPETNTVFPVFVDMVSCYKIVGVLMADGDTAAMFPVAVMMNNIVGEFAVSHTPADV